MLINSKEAFTFYKSIFVGGLARIMRYKDLASLGYKDV